MSTVTCDGSCYLWWVLLPVMGPVTCEGPCYLWWVLLPVMGSVTCDWSCYLWRVLLPVRGPVTCDGFCYLWWVLAGEDPDAVVILVDYVHVHFQIAEVRLGLIRVGRVAGLAVSLLLEATRSGAGNTDAWTSETLEVWFLWVFGRRRLETATTVNPSISGAHIQWRSYG